MINKQSHSFEEVSLLVYLVALFESNFKSLKNVFLSYSEGQVVGSADDITRIIETNISVLEHFARAKETLESPSIDQICYLTHLCRTNCTKIFSYLSMYPEAFSSRPLLQKRWSACRSGPNTGYSMEKDGPRFFFEATQGKKLATSSSRKKLMGGFDMELENAFDLSDQPTLKSSCQILVPVNPALELDDQFKTNLLENAQCVSGLWNALHAPNAFLVRKIKTQQLLSDLESLDLRTQAIMIADQLQRAETVRDLPNHSEVIAHIRDDFKICSMATDVVK